MTNESGSREKKIQIFGESDCCGLTKSLSFTIRAVCEMADPVDGKVLRRAVDMLEKRFSFLKVSLRKGIRSFYYAENPSPWVVKETDRPIDLNGEESNHQLLSFSWLDHTIYINVYHGQMDGTGLYRIMKALLYYYCCLYYGRTFDVPDVALPDEEPGPQEASDVYREFYMKNRHAGIRSLISPQKPIRHPMELDEMGLVHMDRSRRTSFKITLSQADMMKYCSSFDGSPITAVALMLADGIHRMHPDDNRTISIGVPVNLRPALGFKHSIASIYAKIYIPYSEKIRSMDFEKQGTVCRGMVIRYSDHDLLRSETMKYCGKLNMLQFLPLSCLKQCAARVIARQMKKAETAGATYIGKFTFGEMEPYIRSTFLDVDSYGIGVMVLLAAFADRFFITIDQDWPEKAYTESFLQVLRDRGIAYTGNYDGALHIPEMCM